MKKSLQTIKSGIVGVIFAGALFAGNANAQDIHFSQFYEEPLDMNPAMCGAFPGMILGELNYRTQWSSVAGSGYGFSTMAATAEYHNLLKNWTKGYLSPGLNFYSDQSGDAKIGITQVNFTLASGIYLSDRNCLAVGLQAGYAQHSINTANLQWDNQYDQATGQYNPNLGSGEPGIGNSFSYVDFAAGILYSYGTGQTNMTQNDICKFNVGGAIYHISQPQMSYYSGALANAPGTKLYMRYVANSSLIYGIPNSNISICPAAVFYMQGPATELDLGSKFRYVLRQESKYTGIHQGSAFDLGCFYRLRDAIIVMAGLEFGSYAFMVSYDVNVSSLTTASSGRGGLELSLRFINPNPFMGGTESGTTTHSMF